MRANMRCTLVAWLSPGSTSAGQLNGNRPVSSTYSVTPHDLQAVESRVQGVLSRSASCMSSTRLSSGRRKECMPSASSKNAVSPPGSLAGARRYLSANPCR
jgi:hypothetical protein